MEITSILNQDLYDQTVADCVDSNGKITCLTLADVHAGKIGTKQAEHLCAALTSQPNGIFPGADLVSDFSEIGNSPNPPNKIPPTLTMPYSCSENTYAACMTAPCKHTGKIDPLTGLPLALCTCPTFDGPNQVWKSPNRKIRPTDRPFHAVQVALPMVQPLSPGSGLLPTSRWSTKRFSS